MNQLDTILDTLRDDGDVCDLDEWCRHCKAAITEGVDDDEARTHYWEDQWGYTWCLPLELDRTQRHEPDTRKLRLKMEPDDMSILDEQGEGVWCGRLEPVDWYREGSRIHHRATNAYGLPVRPDGFDGRARKIQANGGDAMWWQPPDDLDEEGIESTRKTLLDLLEYGYRIVVVELLDGEDAYRRPIVSSVASLGGVESFPDASYLREVISDLLGELDGFDVADGNTVEEQKA